MSAIPAFNKARLATKGKSFSFRAKGVFSFEKLRPPEIITENGNIRTLIFTGPKDEQIMIFTPNLVAIVSAFMRISADFEGGPKVGPVDIHLILPNIQVTKAAVDLLIQMLTGEGEVFYEAFSKWPKKRVVKAVWRALRQDE